MTSTSVFLHSPGVVYADSEQTISLQAVLNATFGSLASQMPKIYAYSFSAQDLVDSNCSYWDPSNPKISQLIVSGQPIAFDTTVTLPSASNWGTASWVAGNSIVSSIEIGSRLNPASDSVSYKEWQKILVLSPQFQSDWHAVPTATDIVNTALHFSAVYSGVPNRLDCYNIATAIGAATGAPIPYEMNSSIPENNHDGGLWRVVYRASATNPNVDWQGLLQPGDLVRFFWNGATPGITSGNGVSHAFIALSTEQADGTVLTFDNSARNGTTSVMGLHYKNFENLASSSRADPSMVTIYRLSPDHLNLINADWANGTAFGTVRSDDIIATLGGEAIKSGEGDDTIRLTLGGNIVDGGSGNDTVTYGSARASATLTKTSTGWMVKSSSGATDVLSNVERIQFSDSSVAYDTSGNAGQVYRLYQAAFNRTPDKGGLGDWIYGMDNGASLFDVSAGFIASAEFKLVYGQNPTDSEVVTRFYQNVLHRAPEQAGFDYWMNQLQSGAQTRTQVLTGFSESAENQAQVIGVIQNGIEYAQHHA